MDSSNLPRAALRGEPSYVWRAGQARRWEMIVTAAGGRERGRVLDCGCGIGAYLGHMETQADRAYGLEYDFDRAQVARLSQHDVVCAASEHLPFPSGTFDLILSHEVLEHVSDDHQSVRAMLRVLRKGGRLVVFVPNRGYPFETHGIFWRGRYHFGNIPLVNYLPRSLRDKLAPHVRVYSPADIRSLFEGLACEPVSATIIFGAYDNLIARWPTPGRILRRLLQAMEATPLRALGLSHFWVLEKL